MALLQLLQHGFIAAAATELCCICCNTVAEHLLQHCYICCNTIVAAAAIELCFSSAATQYKYLLQHITHVTLPAVS